jgi:signal transduction histidine kinase
MQKLRHNSITRKLARMNIVVYGAALLATCSALVAYDLMTYRESMVHNLSTQAQIEGANSVPALLFNDPQSAVKTLSALQVASHIDSAAIYTLDGRPFATYLREPGTLPPVLPPVPPGEIELRSFLDGHLAVTRTIVFQLRPVGTVYIRSDLREMNHRLENFAGIATVALLGSLIAAIFVASIFQRAVADPIVHLAEISQVVTRDENYSLRATPTGAGDEPDILIAAFNEMLQQIQRRDEDLRKAQIELERRVEDRTAQLATSNKELEAFSYSVSHDLRAPLRSIDGFSLALMEDCADKLDQQGQHHLQRIRAATQRMGLLIDDLLNLSRVTRAEIRKEKIDLSNIARKVVAGLCESQPGRHIDFQIEDHLEAHADPGLSQVVLENLLNNACKFTSKRTSARIEFGRTKENGSSAYFVRDNGAGFDPAYGSRMFGAFQRLHGTNEFPGTGIGLATVQRIISRHGGKIWAEGAVEKGATFYFTL